MMSAQRTASFGCLFEVLFQVVLGDACIILQEAMNVRPLKPGYRKIMNIVVDTRECREWPLSDKLNGDFQSGNNSLELMAMNHSDQSNHMNHNSLHDLCCDISALSPNMLV